MKILLEQDGWRFGYFESPEGKEFKKYRLTKDEFGGQYWIGSPNLAPKEWGPVLTALVDRLKMLEAVKEEVNLIHEKPTGVDVAALRRALTTNPNGKWKEEE